MNAGAVLLSSLVLGTAFGFGITWADFGHAPDRMVPDATKLPVSNGEQPRLEVNQYNHDFGMVERGAKIRHVFVFTNRGSGVLKLTPGTTTCSACTIAMLEASEIAPGQSTDVTVEYSANAAHPSFRQTATVLTNDPHHSRVELTISGKLTNKFLIWPRPVDFGNVPAGEAATAEFQFRYLLDGELRIIGHEFENADASSFFDVQTIQLSADEAAKEDAKGGYRFVLSLKPGLPLGTFQQTIRLKFEMEPGGQQAEETVPITGTIVSDLSLVGPGWRSKDGVLLLGTVDSHAGLTRKLTLLMRGTARGQVEIEPIKLDPPQIQVRVGRATPLNETVDQMPIEIEIPPGLAPAIRLGTDQGPFGEVVLGVKNHPDVAEIRLKLKFVIK